MLSNIASIEIPALERNLVDWLRGTPRDNRPIKSWPDRDEAWLYVANDVRAVLAKFGMRGSAGASPTPVAAIEDEATAVVK